MPPNHLEPGQNRTTGQQLLSTNGKNRLTLQSDGNLVLNRVDTGAVLWASNTQGKPMTRVLMQPDGNLVGYNDDLSVVYWRTRTQGNPGAKLVLQDDGSLVIVDAQGLRHGPPIPPSGTHHLLRASFPARNSAPVCSCCRPMAELV